MAVRKRGNSWYVDFEYDRLRYRKRSPENTRAGAQAYEVTLRQRLARGEPLVPEQVKNASPTFASFSEQWMNSYVRTNNKFSEIRNKATMLRANLGPFFGGISLDAINVRHIEEYKALKLQAGLSPKTVNNHLSCLRKCLNTAAEWEIVTTVPRIRLLKVPPPGTFFLTVEECDALLRTATGMWREMIFTVLRTGLRFGELIALQWHDIDETQQVLTVERSIVRNLIGSPKSNRIRRVPIADDLLAMFRGMERHGHFVFLGHNGTFLKQEACCVKLVRLGEAAGIRRIGWHALRHTFASHLANNGVTIQAIQELLGHSDLKTTMRYAHLAPETLVSAIRVLETKSAKRVTGASQEDAHGEPAGLR